LTRRLIAKDEPLGGAIDQKNVEFLKFDAQKIASENRKPLPNGYFGKNREKNVISNRLPRKEVQMRHPAA
jgi:hypothetical protein